MKLSTIPAQITTVEDRIAGNLNLTQIILLAIPLFVAALIFFALPPIGKFVIYKLIVSLLIFLVTASLAIRLNGRILLDILKLRLTYEIRPRIYVYRRQILEEIEDIKIQKQVQPNELPKFEKTKLATNARLKGQKLLTDTDYQVVFSSKSGGLSVKVSAT